MDSCIKGTKCPIAEVQISKKIDVIKPFPWVSESFGGDAANSWRLDKRRTNKTFPGDKFIVDF